MIRGGAGSSNFGGPGPDRGEGGKYLVPPPGYDGPLPKGGSMFPRPDTQAVFHEGGKVMNTIPPNDFTFYELLNEVVQQEPATSLDPALMGRVAAIGIVKGKPFTPDARIKKILTEALAVANATSTTIYFGPKQPERVKGGNWIQTPPTTSLTILRLYYSPLEPFFDKSGHPSEIGLVS